MKNVHVVFPKFAKAKLEDFFGNEVNYNISNYDEDINTFRHYIMQEDLVELPEIAFLAIYESPELPIGVQLKEIVERAVEIKLKYNQLRMVFTFPIEFKEYKKSIKQLVNVGIYDIHFVNEFSFSDILNWLDKEKTLMDMKGFISTNGEIETVTKTNQLTENQSTEDIQTNVQQVEATENNNRTRRSQKSQPLIKTTEVKEVFVTNTIEQKNIAVMSFTKCAGSTFHSVNLASYISNHDVKVGVYEYPKTKDNQTFLMDMFDFYPESLADEQKKSIPHLIEKNEEFNVNSNTHRNGQVNYYPVNYLEGSIDNFTTQQLLKYLNVGRPLYKIMDFGCFSKKEMQSEDFKDTLAMFDVLIVILDMMPITLLSNYERLLTLQKAIENLSDLQAIFISNQHTNSIKKDHYKHLGIGTPEKCPVFDKDKIFNAMVEKKTLYDFDLQSQIQFDDLYQGILKQCDIKLQSKSKLKKKFNIFGIL